MAGCRFFYGGSGFTNRRGGSQAAILHDHVLGVTSPLGIHADIPVGGVVLGDPAAHRLSTVRNANAIMVLEKGEIIERGNHDQLLALKGRYYELYTGKKELD